MSYGGIVRDPRWTKVEAAGWREIASITLVTFSHTLTGSLGTLTLYYTICFPNHEIYTSPKEGVFLDRVGMRRFENYGQLLTLNAKLN